MSIYDFKDELIESLCYKIFKFTSSPIDDGISPLIPLSISFMKRNNLIYFKGMGNWNKIQCC